MPEKDNKTEKPSSRRRRKARQDGMVAQSQEVASTVVLLAAAVSLWLFGERALRLTLDNVTRLLRDLPGVTFTQSGIGHALREQVLFVMSVAAPIVLLVGLVGVASSVAQTGLLFVTKNLHPKFSNIDPIKGLKRLFSFQAVIKLITSIVKLCIVTLVAYLVLRSRMQWFVGLVDRDAWAVVAVLMDVCRRLMLQIALAMMLVALIDYAYQKYRHEKQLMMTRQEKKDELKNEIGDPTTKQRQWRRRIALVATRIAQAVPTADVVVTNPTHLAVALQWDEDEMAAPRVVAKGRGHVAERIKEIACENGVPILERKEVARALYEAIEVGMEIPPEFYYAVAQILAFVMGLKRGRRRVMTA